jgi:hypothetical protein
MRLPPDASQVVVGIVKEAARAADWRKAFILLLRGMLALFDCDAGAVFLYRRSKDCLYKAKAVGDAAWDTGILLSFYRNLKPALPADTIMAPVRRGNEVIGVMVLRRQGEFPRGAGRIATEALKIVGGVLAERRRTALAYAENGISGAILRGLPWKDVTYRVFHQLRRFIDYDHSATLWLRTGEREGTVVARQVAWTKGKSRNVGLTAGLPWEAIGELSSPAVLGESGSVNGRQAWEPLRSHVEDGAPPKRSALVGRLTAGEALAGCVEIAGSRPNFFLDKDITVLSRFLPHLSWCLAQSHANPGGCHE